jgi:O-antigen ligase
MKNFLLNLVKVGIFAVLLTPFIYFKNFYFPYVGPKSLYFMALAEIVFFAWLALAFKFPRYRPRLNVVTLSLIFLLFAMALSSAFGLNPSQSFWSKFERMTGFLMWLHLFGFYLAASAVFQQKDWKRFFCISIFLGLVMGLMSVFGQETGARGGGTIGNDSFSGTYILFNLFFALYLFLDLIFREGWRKVLRKPAAVAFLAALGTLAFCLFLGATAFWNDLKTGLLNASNFKADILVMGARAAKVSFLGGAVLIFLLWLATQKKRVLKWTGCSFLSVLAVAAAGLFYFSLFQGNIVRDKMSEWFGESTLYERIVVWDIAYKGFLDKPFLGSGPENYEYVFARHFNPCLGSGNCGSVTWYDRAHNIILDTLASTGILGLLAYLAVFASAIFVLWKGFFSNKMGFPEAGVFTALFAAYFTQNLTVFDTPISLMFWFLSLAFVSSSVSREALPEKTGSEKTIHPILIAAAFLICFSQFVFNPTNADHSVIVSIREPFGSAERIADYKKTLDFSPTGRYQIRQFFAQTFLVEAQKGKLASAARIRELEFLAGELEKSVREAPQDYKSYLMLSELYLYWAPLDSGKLEQAEKNAQKTIELAPANQKGYWLLAQVRLYQERIGDALSLAQKACDLDPANGEAQAILDKIKKMKEADALEKQ